MHTIVTFKIILYQKKVLYSFFKGKFLGFRVFFLKMKFCSSRIRIRINLNYLFVLYPLLCVLCSVYTYIIRMYIFIVYLTMYKYYCSAYFIVIQEFLLLDFFIYGDPSDITNADVSSSNDHYNLRSNCMMVYQSKQTLAIVFFVLYTFSRQLPFKEVS